MRGFYIWLTEVADRARIFKYLRIVLDSYPNFSISNLKISLTQINSNDRATPMVEPMERIPNGYIRLSFGLSKEGINIPNWSFIICIFTPNSLGTRYLLGAT